MFKGDSTMKFNELLNQYMNTLDCSGKELSDRTGLSSSLISRYRNGEREPQPDSEAIRTLAHALSTAALDKGVENFPEEAIFSAFQEVLLVKSRDYEAFLHKFNTLYDELHLNMKDISAFTNFDTSFLYRIKSGERKTSDLPAFRDKIANYLVTSFSAYEDREKIASLLDIDVNKTSDSISYYTAICQWLLPDSSVTGTASENRENSVTDISRFLKKVDEFDLEDYIRVVHFDEIKVPTLPLHLPSTKYYYGIERMREGELDFFKMTVTSKTSEPIFMCSDMPMLDMAESNDFNKKWMFAIACSLKKGLHLNMVHYLERPFEELLLGLEAWVPIYMTGQISPYYLVNNANQVYHHLNYVSGVAALCGESIEGAPLDGRYILTNNKEELSYFHKKAKHILSHAKPLMEIFDRPRLDAYQAFLQKDAQVSGERKNILSSLPIYTISEALLDRILASNQVAASDAQIIRSYRASEVKRMKQKLKNCVVTDEISLPARQNYSEHPMHLSVSGCFYEAPLMYSYEEMNEHLKETQAFEQGSENYHLMINEISAFRNIQIEIVQDQYVIVSKIKSPSIHFVIEHPQLVHALQNFTIPVIEPLPIYEEGF